MRCPVSFRRAGRYVLHRILLPACRLICRRRRSVAALSLWMVLGLSLSGSVRTAIPDSLSPVYGPIHYYVAFSLDPADRYSLAPLREDGSCHGACHGDDIAHAVQHHAGAVGIGFQRIHGGYTGKHQHRGHTALHTGDHIGIHPVAHHHSVA